MESRKWITIARVALFIFFLSTRIKFIVQGGRERSNVPVFRTREEVFLLVIEHMRTIFFKEMEGF